MTMQPEMSVPLRAAGRRGSAKAERASGHRGGRLDVTEHGRTEDRCVIQKTPSGFLVTLDVEMTRARAALERRGETATGSAYAKVLTRAAAVALSRQDIAHRMQQRRSRGLGTLAKIRRWGWLLPFGWLRRLVLGVVLSPPPFRALFGALQVVVLPGADPPSCRTPGPSASLGLHALGERVVIRRGQPAVRWMATLSCWGNFGASDGPRIARVLSEVKGILESCDSLDGFAHGAANDVTP
jgi:hypothetical protein